MKKEAYFFFSRSEDLVNSDETDRGKTEGRPDWLKDAVIYDILIDSFAASRRSIGEMVVDMECDKEFSGGNYGGTIQGITDNLDYLLKLGINCLCIDPFILTEDHASSEQAGGYSFRLNPNYGSEAEFCFMVDLCHNCSIRVIVKTPQEAANASQDMDYLGLCRILTEKYSVDGWHIPGLESIDDNFINSCRNFFARDMLDAFEFDLAVKDMVREDQQNWPFVYRLGSLGMPRFITYCDSKKERFLMAILFQLTFIGQPCILYGDEQVIFNQAGEKCNSPMLWGENFESEIFAFYKAAIYLRRRLGALRRGDYQTLCASKASKLYVFERCQEMQKIIVALNAGEEQTELPEEFENYQTIWQRGYASCRLDGFGFLILTKQSD